MHKNTHMFYLKVHTIFLIDMIRTTNLINHKINHIVPYHYF